LDEESWKLRLGDPSYRNAVADAQKPVGRVPNLSQLKGTRGVCGRVIAQFLAQEGKETCWRFL
jgi:hypothetical protein